MQAAGWGGGERSPTRLMQVAVGMRCCFLLLMTNTSRGFGERTGIKAGAGMERGNLPFSLPLQFLADITIYAVAVCTEKETFQCK